MRENYEDAMAIVTRHGKPDLFITMTMNPKSPPVLKALEYEYEGETYNHEGCFRPEILVRVFDILKKQLIKQL